MPFHVLRRAGVSIRSIDIAGMLARLDEATTTVMFYEAAQFHQQRYKEHGSRLADLADLVRDGLLIPVARYDEARRYIAECKAKVKELYKATPVILVPAATGPAPRGLASTGDARMNAPWTALGTPAISIPMPVAEPGRVAARAAAHGRPRRGRESDSHGGTAADYARPYVVSGFSRTSQERHDG